LIGQIKKSFKLSDSLKE